jgi:hypothetical protein
MFAYWVNNHVTISETDEPPFMIVFGDINMHETVQASAIKHYLGDGPQGDVNAIAEWKQVTQKWNTWFLRRPTGKAGDKVDQQWGEAIGEQKVFHIQDEQRAVDYAMGLVARAWGHFPDFQDNMRARQPEEKVDQVSKPIVMICPRCGGPIPVEASGMFSCTYCGVTLKI